MIAVAAVALLATALRLYHLSAVSLRGDEAFSVLFSADSLINQARNLRAGEPHPPLYFAGLHYWLRLAGDSDFAARFPSVAFGVLLVPLAYSTARRAAGPSVALIGAFLVALNPFLLWYSQDARSYTLIPALALVSLYFTSRLLDLTSQRVDRVAWLGVVSSGALLLLTHYATVYFLAAANLGAALLAVEAARRRISGWPRVARSWLASQAALAFVALPWYFYARDVVLAKTVGWAAAPDLPALLVSAATSYSLGPLEVTGAQRWLVALFAPPLLVGLVALWRGRAGRFAVICLLAPLVAAFVASLFRPVFLDRYFVFVVPLYCLALAAGIERLRRGRRLALAGSALFALVVASVWAMGLYYFDPLQAKSPNWRAAGGYVASHFLAGDLLIADTADPAIVYYARVAARRAAPSAYADEVPPRASESAPKTEARLAAILNERDRVWLAPSRDGGWDPNGVVEGWLAASAAPLESTQFGGLGVRLFATPRSLLGAHPRPEARSFAGTIDFLGFDLSNDESVGNPAPLEVRPGDAVWLTLYFRAAKETPADLRVFNHLVDAQGQTRAQHDGVPSQGKRPTYTWRAGDLVIDRHRVEVPADAPSGPYAVRTGLYDATSTQRLPVVDATGKPIDDSVQAGEITVRPR